MQTETFVGPKQSSESVSPVSGILPGRLTFVCWLTIFCGWAVLRRCRLTPTWWNITCTGGSDRPEVEKRLQVWMPSAHVWPNCVLPASPHFLNQAPPRAQQLRLPDFLEVAHLAHALLCAAGGLVASLYKCSPWDDTKYAKRKLVFVFTMPYNS